MATSLLRLGRLGSVKCLLREGWRSTPRAPFAAALCTKGDVPPKTPKKAKASTIEADERASLLAYKPAVAFPSKLSAAGLLLKDVALGKSETAEAVSTAAANETTTDSPVAETAAADIAVEEAKITEVPTTDGATTEIGGSKTSDVKAEVQKDQDDTSSSSSSDSDSDSDSDDEKPKTETPVQSGEKAAGVKKAPGLTTEEVGFPDKEVGFPDKEVGVPDKEVGVPDKEVGFPDKEANPETTAFGEAQESAETVTKATPEEVPAPSAKPVGSVETLIDPAPVLSSTSEAVPEVSSESIPVATSDKILDSATEIKTAPTEEIAVEKEPEIKVEEAVKVSAEVLPEVTAEVLPEVTAEVLPEVTAEVLPEVTTEVLPEVTTEVLPKVTTEARSEDVADTAVDAGPEVSSEAPGDVPAPKAEAGTLKAEGTPSEELVDPAPVTADAVEALAEADVVETPEEQAPEKAPEPEPFDNTTYQNLQHHQYDAYTFADLDVEMAKHRLPQPSAARR